MHSPETHAEGYPTDHDLCHLDHLDNTNRTAHTDHIDHIDAVTKDCAGSPYVECSSTPKAQAIEDAGRTAPIRQNELLVDHTDLPGMSRWSSGDRWSIRRLDSFLKQTKQKYLTHLSRRTFKQVLT